MRGNNNMRGHRLVGGSAKVSSMEAFDRLPKAVRQALAESDHNWSAYQAYAVLRRTKHKRPAQAKDAAALVAFIRAEDSSKRVQAYALRATGNCDL